MRLQNVLVHQTCIISRQGSINIAEYGYIKAQGQGKRGRRSRGNLKFRIWALVTVH